MEHKVPQILKDEFEILPTTPGNAERSVPPLSYSNDHGDYAFDNDTKTLSYLSKIHLLFYYPPEVCSMKYCCLGVFMKEYFRLVTK